MLAVGCFIINAQQLLRNIMRMFPRPAFSLEKSYSLPFGRNIPFVWVEVGITHPLATLFRILREEWAPYFWGCSHESCRVAAVPHLLTAGLSWLWLNYLLEATDSAWNTAFLMHPIFP